MDNVKLLETIKAKYPMVETADPQGQGKMAQVTVPLEKFRPLMEWLHSDAGLDFKFPMCQTGVDYPDRKIILSTYHLYSFTHRHKIQVKVELNREDPRIPTVSDLWRGCEWFERETYDMFGVVFENHPDLRRIMMTDDWVGWPLRKDYKDSRIVEKPY